MTKTSMQAMTSKWLLVVEEYERVKQKRSKHFHTVQEICDTFRVHRKDIAKYYERWVKAGRETEALMPQKRGPKPGRLKILSKEEERTIMAIHRRLAANEFEIHEIIKGRFNVHPSVSTIYRTFKRYPLNKKRIEKIRRYEKKYPGEQAHSDTCQLDKTFFSDRKTRYLFGLLDDCTRLCYVELIENNQAATVSKAFARAYKWMSIHGFLPKEVLTDNGPEFTAYTSRKARETHFFETMLHIFDVKHRYTRPYRPQTNGKIERFWKTINQECVRVQPRSPTPKEFEAELEGFMYRYNYQRKHGGLKYHTPLDKLNYVTEIMK